MRLSRLFFYTILFGALGYFSYRAYQTVTRGGNAINAERDYTYQELRQSDEKKYRFLCHPKRKTVA